MEYFLFDKHISGTKNCFGECCPGSTLGEAIIRMWFDKFKTRNIVNIQNNLFVKNKKISDDG